MATLHHKLQVEEPVIDFCLKKARPFDLEFYELHKVLLDKRGGYTIATSSVVEESMEIVSQGKLIADSTIRKDFTDGSDAKYATVHIKKNGTYQAKICHVEAKIGLLRCLIYNFVDQNMRFFLIPHDAYKDKQQKLKDKVNISNSISLTIPFTSDGKPKIWKSKNYKLSWFAKYEVFSFEDLCQFNECDAKEHSEMLEKRLLRKANTLNQNRLDKY